MKAIILARVSTKEQEDNNSIPAQTRRLNEYAVRFGLDIIATHELVESSTKLNRTKFNDIIKEIKDSKECIALVTDTIDRLQRSFRDSVVLDELRLLGKLELHFMREGLIINKESNSSEILRWDMGVMFAKSYVTQLSDNVRRSLEQKMQNGEWLSKAPYGYSNVKRADGSNWIEPNEYALFVRAMFKWYSSGSFSMKQVQKLLFDEYNIKKSLSSVDKILKNPFYYGVMRIKGQEYSHRYTPIINKDMFDSVQTICSRFKKKHFKFAGLPYDYRGLISCAICECRITPEKSKGYIYYHCTQHKGKHNAPYVREEDITAQFMEALRRIQPTQEQYRDVLKALKASHKDILTNKARMQSQLSAELEKINNRITRLYDSYLDGDIDKDFYRSKNLDFKQSKLSLDSKLQSINSANDEYYENAQSIMDLVRNAPEHFKSSKMDSKRQLLNIVFQNLELNDRELRWKYKKPFDSMASYKNDSSWLGIRDSNQIYRGSFNKNKKCTIMCIFYLC